MIDRLLAALERIVPSACRRPTPLLGVKTLLTARLPAHPNLGQTGSQNDEWSTPGTQVQMQERMQMQVQRACPTVWKPGSQTTAHVGAGSQEQVA